MTASGPDEKAIDALRRSAAERRRQGRRQEAFALYRQILDRRPDDAEALTALGLMARDMGQPTLAARFLIEATTVAPTSPELRAALTGVIEALRAVTVREPGNAEAHFRLATALRALGSYGEALRCHRRALRLDPRLARTDDFRAIPLLAEGRLAEGWWEFEWRSTVESLGPFTELVWEGDDLSGKTILVWGEQGIGDQMMFATCLPDLMARAGKCILEVDRRLVPLFARSFPGATVHGGQTFRGGRPATWADLGWLAGQPTVERFVLLGSLPRFFRPSLASFPQRRQQTLVADAQAAAAWRRRLRAAAPGRPRLVGVCWRSILLKGGRADLYPPLALWGPVFSLAETTFVCLQANVAPAELEEIRARFGVEPAMTGVDLVDDLDATAALIESLDAVVSADTYIAMMAGALGRPTRMMTRADRKKIWCHLGADEFPWFPSLTAAYAVSEEELRAAFSATAASLSGGS